MADLKQYIASSGAGELPAEAELDALLARCEWFDLARIVREIATGRPDPRLDVTAPWRAQSSLRMAAVDADALCRLSSDDIIDRFLREEDVRIVAATNRDLRQMVANGTFREDLYFRLNTVELTVPPLRERREDIRGLAQSRLRSFDETYGRRHTLTEEALRLMERYVWPGNLRELSHCVEKAVVLTPDGDILPRDLPKSLFDISEAPPPESAPGQPLDEALEALGRAVLPLAKALQKAADRKWSARRG